MDSSRSRSQGPPPAEAEALFRELRRTGDPGLRDRLVALHTNLVRYLAGKFAHRGEPLEDLIQVGMIGLIHAVDRYDPERGLRFSTYATPTIVGEIKRHFRDRSWNLKVPRWLQELNLRVMRANQQLAGQLGRSPTLAEIAAHVGCPEEDALRAVELGSAHDTVSLDARLAAEGDVPLTLNDSLGGEDEELDRLRDYDDLKTAIEQLDHREKVILYLRFFQELSQSEVASRLSISQMHVSRLQNRALARLKQLLSDEQPPGPLRDAA